MSGNEFERFCLKQGQGLMAAVEGSTTLLKLLFPPSRLHYSYFVLRLQYT